MKKAMMAIALLFAIAPVLAAAQGRPGGQGQRQSRPRAQQGRSTGSAQGQMDRDRIRQQLHTHATTQQRDQFRTCTKDMNQLRTRSRDMVRATGKGFNVGNARQQRDRFQEQFQAMQQQHERMMNGLDPAQRSAMQNRIRNMDQIRSQVQTRLQEINQELGADSPNRQRVQEQARFIEREMQRWQKEYRAMGEDLSL